MQAKLAGRLLTEHASGVTYLLMSLLDKLTQIGIGGIGTIRTNRLMNCPLADLAKSNEGPMTMPTTLQAMLCLYAGWTASL